FYIYYSMFGFQRIGDLCWAGGDQQARGFLIGGTCGRINHLSSSQDEARYEVRLEPRMARLTRSRQNAIYQNRTVPQIVEKILRERHQMRGQDFVF
ncbi:contractile injection system protein, VgrG/Pvc8 family, partial [Escherichia coli]